MGQEAWSEYRRTGYPRFFPVIEWKCNQSSFR
ncbi:SusD/RagB family nutrient-binding outer membrane lipoprotein [Bacteroides ovatus]|nr:SusD/RagB family nutrient-binding outer membrane lipoprotein [Bacteroides ovatus]